MKEMIERKTDTIQVDSIHQAAYLLAKNIPLKKVVRSGRMGLFFFKATTARLEIENYITGRALIEPRSFASAIRELKRAVDEVIANGQ